MADLPQLAAVVRTGFAPGDRAGISDALAAREAGQDVNAEVPWAQAGPSGADLAVRHYTHDAWHSIAAAIKLPAKGAVLGALAPVLVPTEPGERRSMVVVFPILAPVDRRSADSERRNRAADIAETLRSQAASRPGPRTAHHLPALAAWTPNSPPVMRWSGPTRWRA